MVVGARQAGSQASLGRGIANRVYNRLASYMTGQKIEDLTSGFRAVRAEKFREFLYLLPNGFSYPTTSTMAFFRAGYSVAYEPIHAARRVGKSHIRPLQDGIRFLLIIFKIGTLYSPLKLFAPVAALMFLLGSLWYLHTFMNFGRFTNMSALLFTGSVVVFMMGLISEQITALMYKDAGTKRRERKVKRLLLVTRNFPPLWGGMERLNQHLADELALEYDVRLIAPEGAEAFSPPRTGSPCVP
jgi:hypothetical protein